ncbi:hypothetical protein [Ramlibacter sp.]|uniref:DUF7936 family protein n=1 Tax=Ramlibacter sp. TaxID=1917967 RepID=UPI003D0A6B31
MTIAYTWTVTGARASDVGELEDVIVEVDFVVTAAEGDTTVQTQQRVQLLPPGEDFVPFAELTPQQVIEWVKLACDAKSATRVSVIEGYLADRMQLHLQAAAAAQLAPQEKPLPWAQGG